MQVTLGGRTFAVIDFDRRTVRQDHYLQRYIRSIGADRVMPMDGEDSSVFTVRLQTHIVDSGQAAELVAGYLLPLDKAGRDFTPDMAKEIAAHIGACDSKEDRETVAQLAVQAAYDFFVLGLEQRSRSLAYLLQASAAKMLSADPPDQVH